MKSKITTIKSPRITEKASLVLEKGIYTFNLSKDATKTEVKKMIFELYKVKPVKVNIVNMSDNKLRYRGRFTSTEKGGKKAYIYLKKGDKIDFV